MTDPTEDLVADETRDTESKEARQGGSADRPPTAEEERLAEEHELDPKVAAAHEEANVRGANVEGEGKID